MKQTFLLVLVLIASGLAAQPPVDGPGPGPKDPPLAPPQPAGPSAAEIQGMIEEEVDIALRKRLDEFAPLRSRRQLFIEFSGGVMTKYRQAQKSSSGDQPDGGRRAPNGIALGRAWISIFAAYSDIVESELELRFNGDYTLLDRKSWRCRAA